MFTPGAGKKKGEFSGTVDPSDSSDSDEEMVDVSAIPAIGKPNAGKGKEKAVAVASDEEKPAPSKKDKGKGKAPAVDVKSSAARPNKVSKTSYMYIASGLIAIPGGSEDGDAAG